MLKVKQGRLDDGDLCVDFNSGVNRCKKEGGI